MAERGAPVGNSNANRGREWTAALRRAMAHRAEDGNYRTTLLRIANAVIAKAEEGDKEAWKEIADREDGKAAQAVELTGADGGPVETSLRVTFGNE